MGRRPHIWSLVTGIPAAIGLLIAPYVVLVYADIEMEMGLAQKIFYYHVPSAMAMYAGIFLLLVFSLLYLWRKSKLWDIWASSAAEVALLFCTLVLLTGPLWAKPVWGAWWVWDAQLTLTLVLWLMLVAYKMLQSYSEDWLQSAQYRAVLGIVCALDAPFIHYATQLWRTHHPEVVRGESIDLPHDMKMAFFFCVITFLAFFTTILLKRVSLELANDELQALKSEVIDRKSILGQLLKDE